MQVELISSNPHEPLGPRLAAVIEGASRVRAAVAFMTGEGVNWVSKALAKNPGVDFKLLVSVRWPTNLAALAKLAEKRPDSVWLHLCGVLPKEVDGEVYQFHPKLLVAERADGAADVVVGSHNWTGMALHGLNQEASMHVRCAASDKVVKDALGFFDQSQHGAEEFHLGRLGDYLAIQAKLRGGPWSQSPQLLDGVESSVPRILFAESGLGGSVQPKNLRISLVLPEEVFDAGPVAFGQKAALHLFQPGTLLLAARRARTAFEYRGEVVLLNRGKGTPDQASLSNVNAFVGDVHHPVVEPTRRLGYLARPGVQVLLALERHGDVEVPVPAYFSSRPTVRHRVEPASNEARTDELRTVLARQNLDSLGWLTRDSFEGKLVRFEGTTTVEDHVDASIASKLVHSTHEVEAALGRQTREVAARQGRTSREVDVSVCEPKPASGASLYFIAATHRLTLPDA